MSPIRRDPRISRRGGFSRIVDVGTSTYYLQMRATGGSQSGQTFVGYFHEAMLAVDSMKPKHLIIDLRSNNGGDGSQIKPFIQEIADRRANPPWSKCSC